MRKERLELSRVSPLGPKPSASTSSATFARATNSPGAPTLPVGTRRPCIGVGGIIAHDVKCPAGNEGPANQLARRPLIHYFLVYSISYIIYSGRAPVSEISPSDEPRACGVVLTASGVHVRRAARLEGTVALTDNY